jgi:hypothetical protein
MGPGPNPNIQQKYHCLGGRQRFLATPNDGNRFEEKYGQTMIQCRVMSEE